MPHKPKSKLGRPAFADPNQVRSVVRTIKITPAEDKAWRTAADEADVSVNEWIRDQVERSTIAKIVVSPDDGDWHWVAYNAKGDAISTGSFAAGLKVEDCARQFASGHGLRGAENAVVEVER